MAQTKELKTSIPGLKLVQMNSIDDDRRYLSFQHRNREHIAEFGNKVDETIEEVTARRSGRIIYGIYLNEELIGALDFVPHGDGKEAEVGISLDKEAVGHGYATAAIRAGLSHMAPKFDRLFAEVHPDNEPSLRLCRRVGLVARPGLVQRQWGPALVFDYKK